MCNNFPNIRITEGNNFSLVLPLRSRTYVATKPIDEDIDPEQLENVVVTFGGVEYPAQRTAQGVQIDLPATLAAGTYNILLTAEYLESSIRAAYESAVTIVPWSAQSTAEQYIAGSPIVLRAAYVLSCVLTDAELEALKQEAREKIAEAEQAKEEAEQAKAEWEQKASDLDGVAQEATSQSILTAVENIDIDTSDLAKQGTNAGATNTAILEAIGNIGADQQLIQECYDVAEEKYATMPQHKTLANLPDTLQTINATEQGDIVVSALTIANAPECEYTNLYKVYFRNAFPSGGSGSYNYYLRAVYNIRGYSSGWVNAFTFCPNIEDVTFSNFTINGGTDLFRAYNIKRFDMTGLYVGDHAGGNFDQMFFPSLTTLIGNHTLDEVLDGLAVMHNNNLAFNLAREVLLRREDFRAVINGLKDLTGETAKTLTLGATNLAKLTAEDIAIATAKNWTLA